MGWRITSSASTQGHVLLNPQKVLKDKFQPSFERRQHWMKGIHRFSCSKSSVSSLRPGLGHGSLWPSLPCLNFLPRSSVNKATDSVWEEGHLRAVDNSHWDRTEETRVPFHGSSLQVLEDNGHFPPHSIFILQAPLFLTWHGLNCLPHLVSLHWLWPLFLLNDHS